jgi:hypothetical protein
MRKNHFSVSLFAERDLKDRLTHKTEPYCGKAGVEHKLCHKARVNLQRPK